jgi:hypothetical protein
MTHIRRNTSARHRRNISRAQRRIVAATYNPMAVYFCQQAIDIIF